MKWNLPALTCGFNDGTMENLEWMVLHLQFWLKLKVKKKSPKAKEAELMQAMTLPSWSLRCREPRMTDYPLPKTCERRPSFVHFRLPSNHPHEPHFWRDRGQIRIHHVFCTESHWPPKSILGRGGELLMLCPSRIQEEGNRNQATSGKNHSCPPSFFTFI